MQITDFPAFCTQPSARIAVLFSTDRVLFAYERARDFLSTPRTFVILESPPESIVMLNASYLSDEQWQQLEEKDFGIYRIQSENDNRFIFYGLDQAIDLQTEKLEQAAEVYHVTNSELALARYVAGDLNPVDSDTQNKETSM